jgi:nucleoside 2-deoxyribosyltransferase
MKALTCFAIMPFAKPFNDVYATMQAASGDAVQGEDIRCMRLDEIKSAGRISADLIRTLEGAALCIADVTGLNANVMWEVGYAMALKTAIANNPGRLRSSI